MKRLMLVVFFFFLAIGVVSTNAQSAFSKTNKSKETVVNYANGGQSFQLVYSLYDHRVSLRLPFDFVKSADSSLERVKIELLKKEVQRLSSGKRINLGNGYEFLSRGAKPDAWKPFNDGDMDSGERFKSLIYLHMAVKSGNTIIAIGPLFRK